MTAKADAIEPNKSDDLVDFASDPDSRVYGGGVVAVGGTRMVGQRAARTGGDIRASRYPRLKPKGSPSHQSPGATDLSRRPRLTEADPCRGFFPPSAMNNSALAAVMVVVDLTGRVDTATVISEFPAGQGFGGAARTCLLTKRFVPALDRAGHRTRAAIHVNVRFRR